MKMKKMLAVLSALCMMCAVVPVLPVQESVVISASAEDSAELFTYYKHYDDSLEPDGIQIFGVNDTSITEVTIPEEIEGLPVVEISYGAFRNCAKISTTLFE